MTNPRPILTHCAKGHEKKATTTGTFCPVCKKEREQKQADRKRAASISKRIRPLYT